MTDVPRVNRSGIHIDFMIGGDDVDVTGITRERRAHPGAPRRRLADLSHRSTPSGSVKASETRSSGKAARRAASRTAFAETASYRKKQISSSGTKIERT